MREELIQAEPSIMMGKPVIAGTRITVELILEKLAAGETIDRILAAHPRMTQVWKSQGGQGRISSMHIARTVRSWPFFWAAATTCVDPC